MCGIIGYVGKKAAVPILLDGLQRLEYRGYDSAGVTVITSSGQLQVKKSVGKLSNLVSSFNGQFPSGTIGAGHTRWATHGPPSDQNAHPHLDCQGRVAILHNGIVENYRELKRKLQEEGHRFVSQTDTEVIPHLIEKFLAQGNDLEASTRLMMKAIEGAHAIVVLSTIEPAKILAVRLGNAGGLVVGYGDGEMFLASDLPAILPNTKKVIFLDNCEMAVITEDRVLCSRDDGEPVEKSPQIVPYDPVSAAKGGYKHFMLKEIMEQGDGVLDTIRGRVGFDPPDIFLEDISLTPEEISAFSRVIIVACGTSLHAGLVGKFMIEELGRLPVEVDYGSEFRYRNPLLDNRTLLISITQSGETVDTLAAMEEARSKGVKQITICNVIGSQATRIAEGVIYTQVGPEIGVASTKAFTAQLVSLYLLATYVGKIRGVLPEARIKELLDDLAKLPHLVGSLLERYQQYEGLANHLFRLSNFLYLGRGINYPIALEGALKLKEISYIHAEGYPAGEMKHGPIALIDEQMPVVAIAVRDKVYDKMISNIEQVKARGGTIIALATEGDEAVKSKADHVLYIPAASPLLTPVLTVIPLQLLAYYIALRRGCDVDQPRNLAKSVTVE